MSNIVQIVGDDFSSLKHFDLIYVASPYTKFDGGINAAFYQIARITGGLVQRELNVYSPIVHTHPIALASGMDPLDHSIWLRVDEAIMNKCEALLVCKMNGWDTSYGVAYEIDKFEKDNKPMFKFDPDVS